jgi:UDP-2,3-diacylglucosamine pyrophosphatase LpxH
MSCREEYVLVSDVHLNEIIPAGEPGWWEYKTPASRQDGALAAFLRAIDARRPRSLERSVIVFNGDTFDFDTCFSAPEGVRLPAEGLGPTVDGSVWKMQRIAGDHPEFIAALAAFLAAGNRAIFVMGNHDRELHFPEVQDALRSAVARAAPPGSGRLVAAAIAFEPWFVHVPGVLYAEHGNQYDATCSYADVLDPTVPADGAHPSEIETPFGSLLGRHTLSRLGTFNPYNDESFILSLGGYARHWFRFYFLRRPFFRAYFSAIWRGLREMRARRARQLRLRADTARPDADQPHYRAYADRKGVPLATLRRQVRLFSRPIVDRTRLLLHEVWLDRFLVIVAAALVVAVGISLVRTWFQGVLLLLLLPALGLVFRAMGRGSLALQERARWGLVAETVAESLEVPVVVFGHSHRPERRPLTGGGRYYNLGTWAPVLDSDRGTTLDRARRYLVVRPDANGRVHTAFVRWTDDPRSDA